MIATPPRKFLPLARLGLTGKLFVAMVVVNILVIAALGIAARVSFNRGFLGYVAELEEERLQNAVAPLTAAYRLHGSWDFLNQNSDMWHQLMRPSVAPKLPVSDTHPMPVLKASALTGAGTRLTLIDQHNHYVFGNPVYHLDSPKRPITFNGQVVGWLLMAPFRSVSEPGDLRFQQRQMHASWSIALVAVLLMAIITLWLVRALASPLRRMATATHRLAEGDYQVRVATMSSGDLGQLEHDFNHLAQALETHERLRSAFLADISHELRTPLAVMRGEVEAMELGVRPLTADNIHSIAGEMDRLNRLVEDLYDLSLADVGALRYRFEALDVADLLEATLPAARRRLEQAQLQLRVELPDNELWVRADERRLQQVIANLIENAARYVDAGCSVTLRVSADAHKVWIDVQDSGAGVPEASLPSLFERFYRVEGSRSRSTGGAGLGLPICRSIIDAHGGSIIATQAPQGGLWIAIALPRMKENG